MRSFRFYRDLGLKMTVALLAALVVFGSPFASVAQPKPVPHPPFPRAAKPPASQDANIVKVQQALKEKGHDPGRSTAFLDPAREQHYRHSRNRKGLTRRVD